MKFYYLFLLFLLFYGCGQKKGPAEVVRIQKGSSLMRQVAPTLKRGSKNVVLIGENVSNSELKNYLNRHNRFQRDDSKHQKLYISGPKAKKKKDFKNRLMKINKRKYKIGKNKNIQNHLRKK